MAQQSSIQKLPQEFFDEVNRALNTPGMTIEKVVAHMATLGVDLSKSAVGRHKKNMADVSDRLRKSRVIAEALGREFGDKADDRIMRTNIELLHGEAMKFIAAGEDPDAPGLDPKQIRELSDAMYRLASAQKLDADRIMKIEVAATKKTAEAASKIVDEVLRKEPGITKETAEEIRVRILGIPKAPS